MFQDSDANILEFFRPYLSFCRWETSTNFSKKETKRNIYFMWKQIYGAWKQKCAQ